MGAVSTDPTGAPSLDPAGTLVLKPLICPPLEKILRSPMVVPIFYTSFVTRRIFGGRRPLLSEILGHADPVGAKPPIFS